MYVRNYEKEKARIDFWYRKKYLPTYLLFIALYPFELEDLEGEIWRWIRGYEGLYQISNFGRVKSFPRKGSRGTKTTGFLIMKPLITRSGYLYVSLKNKGAMQRFKLHRLVSQAFIENPENKQTVNHKDGNKFNNYVDNLEWATQDENNQHAIDTGLQKSGANRNTAKLTNEQVKYIRENYIPRDSEFGGAALARKFNVKSSTVQNVIHGKNYKNVT